MTDFTDDQLLRLYEIETGQVHSALGHVLRVRGTIAVAFAAVLSATLLYQKGLIALGSLVFLAAWYWDYVYDRYLLGYVNRVDQMEKWLSKRVVGVSGLGEAYSEGYTHRLISPGRHPFLASFFDIPRAFAYLAMAFSPLAMAYLLRFPWV